MKFIVHFNGSWVMILQKRRINSNGVIVGSMGYLLVCSCSFRSFYFYLVCVPQVLLLQDLSAQKNWYLSIVFLTLKSGLVHKFNEPLDDRENIIDIKTLKLERLKTIGTFHIDQGVANVLRNFDLLTYLHFVIVLNFNLMVGGSDAPCYSSDNFIKSFKRGDSDSEVASEE